ncbi:MAG: hypothetical protein PHG85_04070, partial [Candidatus Altiarchaeota archaeon]|nr:hypothetical protein [Candidatus Altiarchaeota archaeon]
MNWKKLMANHWLAAVVLYAAVACFITYPVVSSLTSRIYGWGGDSFYTIWSFWYVKYALVHHLPVGLSDMVSAPTGMDFTGSPYNMAFHIAASLPLSLAVNEVFAFNILILSGFVFSGLGLYALAYDLTGERHASLVAGFIYAFSAKSMASAMEGNIMLVHQEFLPLFLLFLLRWDRKRDVRSAVFSGLFFGLQAGFDYYGGVFAMVAAAVFAAYRLVCRARGESLKLDARSIRGVGLMLLVAGVTAALGHLELITNPAILGAFDRPYEQALCFSARISDYVTPPAWHPLWGESGYKLLEDTKDCAPIVSTARVIHLGYVVLILALLGLAAARKEKLVWLFALLGAAGFSISLGPHVEVLGYNIPKFKLGLVGYMLFPMLRTWSRASILVLLAAAILGAYALSRVHSRKTLVAGFVLLLVIVENASIPLPDAGIKLESNAAYDWLASEPRDLRVAEYPMLCGWIRPGYATLIYQTMHEKSLVNYPDNQLAVGYKGALEDFSGRGIDRMLAMLGARYALVHTDSPPSLEGNAGLRLARTFYNTTVYDYGMDGCYPFRAINCRRTFAYTLVYEVTAAPADVFYLVDTCSTDQFSQSEPLNSGVSVRRMRFTEGNVTIVNRRDRPAAVNLSFALVSLGQNAPVTIFYNGARLGGVNVIEGSFSRFSAIVDVPPESSVLTFQCEECLPFTVGFANMSVIPAEGRR